MTKDKDILIDKLMSSNRIKNLGLKREAIADIIKNYNDIIFDTLLENSHVELENGMMIEVVQLLDRVHVLRGVSYKSNRKYKLKLTMEENAYKKIEQYYDRLKEEIQ